MVIEGVAYLVYRSSTYPHPENDESARDEEVHVVLGAAMYVAKAG